MITLTLPTQLSAQRTRESRFLLGDAEEADGYRLQRRLPLRDTAAHRGRHRVATANPGLTVREHWRPERAFSSPRLLQNKDFD